MFKEFMLKNLNREASSKKNKPQEIMENLNLRQSMVIGDIGSGGGYFAQEFSNKVGSTGKVYAIDVNQEFLGFIESNLRDKGISNVETVLANPNGIELPEKSVDLFFLRNVFHHLQNQATYFKNIKKFLKDNGQIAVIDYNKKSLSLAGLFGHYTPENLLIDIMDQAGFSPMSQFDFLENQLFIIFEKS